MSKVDGIVEDGFETILEAFAEAQLQDEGGAQLCIYRHGKRVVDLWTGRDKVNDRPYTADTISIIMSCGKGVTATCAHLLVERGLLDPDAPVAHYWPQFAANGKANIPVSYLLSHRAGLPSFPPESGIALNEELDWNRCVTALASMKPLWTPGTAFMYHQFTYGYLVGEVIRRISGKTVGRFFAEEVAGPLNLDLWIGLPEHEEHRVAPVFSSAPLDPVSAAMGQFLNRRETHVAEIPSLNGIGNARSLAKMYAAIIGEMDGVRLLSRDTVERARKPQTDGLPEIEPGPYPLRFALGYELSRTGSPMLGTGSFGHAGAGGRLGFVHPESGIAVGYVCNNMLWDYTRGPDDRWLPWSKALREVAGL